MLDCLFIGSTTYDMFLLVKEPPASDQRIEASAIGSACGGPGGTAAAAFGALGGVTGLITAVGGDEHGAEIAQDMQGRGFAMLDIQTLPACASPFSVIQVEPDGKRCITCYGGCMSGMSLSMLAPDVLARAKIIHLAGLSEPFLREAAPYCKQHSQALVSVDGGNYSRETTDAILPYVDIFIPDDKTVGKTLGMAPEDACRYYHSKGVSTSCVTLGPEGSVAFDGERFYRAAAYTKARIMDTTGAGDNFHGAFLYGVTQGFDMDKTLRFSNIYSSLTCEALGGRAAAPPLQKVLQIMKEDV